MPIERQKWAHTVVVSEVEQDMAENSENPKKEQKPPERSQWRGFATMTSPGVKPVHKGEHDGGVYGSSDQGVGEAAMSCHCPHRSIQTPEYVDVGELRRQGDHQRRIA